MLAPKDTIFMHYLLRISNLSEISECAQFMRERMNTQPLNKYFLGSLGILTVKGWIITLFVLLSGSCPVHGRLEGSIRALINAPCCCTAGLLLKIATNLKGLGCSYQMISRKFHESNQQSKRSPNYWVL